MRFDETIHPLSYEAFSKEILRKTWTLIPGEPTRFERLVTWTELGSALQAMRINESSERIRLVRNGKEIPERSYLRPHKTWGLCIMTGHFQRFLSEGATLVLNGVEELFRDVRVLAEDAESRLGVSAWANLYAGWRTQQGFDLHWDDHDTLVVQVSGRKAWKVFAPTCESPIKEFSGSQRAPNDPPVWDGILEAGSVLYMPRGWWHYAVPMDEPSLHVTIGLQFPRGNDVLSWIAKELPERLSFRADYPIRGDEHEQIRYLSCLQEALAALISDGGAKRFNNDLACRPCRSARINLATGVGSQKITDDSLLTLSGARTITLGPGSNEQLLVSLHNTKLECSARLGPCLSRLSAVRCCSYRELSDGHPALVKAELQLVLQTLYLGGGLVVERSTSPEQ